MESLKTLKEISALCPITRDRYSTEYNYKSFSEFLLYAPQRMWHNFRVDAYNWSAENELYIFYKKCGESKLIIEQHDKRHIKIPVRDDEDAEIRKWIRENMNPLWKLL